MPTQLTSLLTSHTHTHTHCQPLTHTSTLSWAGQTKCEWVIDALISATRRVASATCPALYAKKSLLGGDIPCFLIAATLWFFKIFKFLQLLKRMVKARKVFLFLCFYFLVPHLIPRCISCPSRFPSPRGWVHIYQRIQKDITLELSAGCVGKLNYVDTIQKLGNVLFDWHTLRMRNLSI